MLALYLLPTVNHVGFTVMPCTTAVHGRPCTLRGAWLPTVYCLLLSMATPAFSDPMGWAATYGGPHNDVANSVQQTSDGGYIVAGFTDSFGAGQEDVWVLKLGPEGTVEWQKTYGGYSGDVADSIQQTSDGGYLVAGGTGSFGAGKEDVWVLKLGPYGLVEWQKTYGGDGGDWVFSIQQTSDGGFIVAGYTGSFGAGKDDIWVLKLRADGAVEWQKTYGGVRGEGAESIQQTRDGGFIVAGNTRSFGAGKEDVWVLKLGPDGLVEWQKAYGGGDFDTAKCVRQTSDGGYIVAGYTGSFGVGKDDIWVLKLRADGAVEWQKTYGGGGIDWANSIHETNGEGYVVAGWTESFGAGGLNNIWVLKLKTDGTVEWQKTYGGGNFDTANCVRRTSDGGFIVAGYTCSSGARGWKFPDACVLRLKPDGSFGYAQDKSIDPSCGFLRDTRISGEDSNATVRPTCVNSRDSNAIPQDSSATVLDTDVSAYFSFP